MSNKKTATKTKTTPKTKSNTAPKSASKTPVKAPVKSAPPKSPSPAPAPAKPKVIVKKPVGRPKLKNDQKVGRPRKPLITRIPSGFKKASTGDTSDNPGTTSNIVFILGIGLIVASGFSSQRIQNALKWAWGMNGLDPSPFTNFLRITGVQLLAIFILSFISRASPNIGRIFTVVLIGVWILWLMKNPQITKLLAAAAKG